MASLEWHIDRAGAISLVQLAVTSDRTARITLESSLTPVWPPRRRGRPIPGWDGAKYVGTVDAGQRLLVGYATPATPADPPATLIKTEPVDNASDGAPNTPTGVVQTLGAARPARDAVPSDQALSGATDGRVPPVERSAHPSNSTDVTQSTGEPLRTAADADHGCHPQSERSTIRQTSRT